MNESLLGTDPRQFHQSFVVDANTLQDAAVARIVGYGENSQIQSDSGRFQRPQPFLVESAELLDEIQLAVHGAQNLLTTRRMIFLESNKEQTVPIGSFSTT